MLVWVREIRLMKVEPAWSSYVMLRDVASNGPWVSAHPDTILKMGTKEMIHRTKHLGWGTDTHLVDGTPNAFREEFPARLRATGPRVLKQNRGNGGQGVWKVEQISGRAGEFARCSRIACAARKSARRDDVSKFMTHCEEYFDRDGCIIDQ